MSSLAVTLNPPRGLSTKRIPPPYAPWRPHKYQERGVDFLCTHTAGALFWDPGLGKTTVVLEAFRRLRAEGVVRRMLVVAPLRVCQLVWRQEGQKWTQFRDLTFSLLHGPKKDKLLRERTDIHLINPEGVAWLHHQYMGRRIPYDIVCVDELTRFKNHRAQRSKKLRKMIQHVYFRWGLTGSPAPNGYMDLFGQVLLLDDGKALGSAITYFRDLYFMQGFNGFDWELRTGADRRIEEKIAPLVLRSAAEDYLELPPIQDNPIHIELPPAAKKLYEEMKKELIVSLPEGVVTAANSGVVYAKLKQLTNGAVYYEDGMERKFAEVHTAKIDALKDLIEELAGQPLLVAYEFQHDLARLRAALGADVPALAGVSGAKAAEIQAEWNAGKIPVLLVHPASAGHGLNMQAAAGQGTAHVCWFSLPWDLELYDQTIRRVYRQGSRASRVINHILMVQGGMDETAYSALEGKDTTQASLLRALNTEVLRDEPAPIATGSVARTQEDSVMAKKLGFKGGSTGAAPAPASKKGWGAVGVTEEDDSDLPPTSEEDEEEEEEQAPPQKKVAKGWGAVAPQGDDDEEEETQPKRIRSKIQAPPPEEDEEDDFPISSRAMKMFPKGVVEQLEGDEEDEEETEVEEEPEEKPEPKKRTRKKAQTEPEPDDEPELAPEKPKDGRFASKAAEDRINGKKAVAAAASPEPATERSTYATATDRAQARVVEDLDALANELADEAGVSRQGAGFSLEIRAYGIPRGALGEVFAALASQLRNGG